MNVVQRAQIYLTNSTDGFSDEAKNLITDLIVEIKNLNKEVDTLMISQCKCPD